MKVLLQDESISRYQQDFILEYDSIYTTDEDGFWIVCENEEDHKLENKVKKVQFYERISADSSHSIPVKLSRNLILFLAEQINKIEAEAVPDGHPSDPHAHYDDNDLPF